MPHNRLTPTPENLPAGGTPPVCLDYIHQFTGGSPRETRELCSSFFVHAGGILTELENEVALGINLRWRLLSHRLRGSASVMGVVRLAALCAEAEAMGDAGLTEKKTLLRQMCRELARARRYLVDRQLIT